jgi:hypothetical protein
MQAKMSAGLLTTYNRQLDFTRLKYFGLLNTTLCINRTDARIDCEQTFSCRGVANKS